ncbi:MAG: hypothetical protein ABIS84_15850 [Arachnia sp.]
MNDKVTQFIETVTLAEPSGSLLLSDEVFPQPRGTEAQAAVVDSNLLTYAEGTPAEVKNSVASWLLFAQRAANAQVAGRDDAAAWVTAYYKVLTDTGWVIRNDYQGWHEENVFGSQVHHNILAFASVVLGPGAVALAILTAAIKSLDDMDKDSPWITLFDRRGRTAKTLGFSVANCTWADGEAGGAALDCVDFTIDAKQVLTKVLFFEFTSKSASMAHRKMVLELSPDAMSTYGPTIKARVDSDILESIAAYELAEA